MFFNSKQDKINMYRTTYLQFIGDENYVVIDRFLKKNQEILKEFNVPLEYAWTYLKEMYARELNRNALDVTTKKAISLLVRDMEERSVFYGLYLSVLGDLRKYSRGLTDGERIYCQLEAEDMLKEINQSLK